MQRLFDDPSPPLGTHESSCIHTHQTHFVGGRIQKALLPVHNFILVTSHHRTRKRQMNEDPLMCWYIQFPVRSYYLIEAILGSIYQWELLDNSLQESILML